MRRAVIVVLTLALAVPVVATGVGDANAQARKQRPNLLDVLRGPRRVTPGDNRSRVRQAPRRTTKRATVRRAAPRRATKRTQRATRRTVRKAPIRRAATTAAPVAAPEAVEKIENASVILVIGDFLAGGIADGFEAAFAESAGVRVIDGSEAASGLVREDYHDWQTITPDLIEKHDPTVVVVQLGANDGQAMRVDGRSLAERTADWTAEYDARARQLAKTIEDSDAELVWVGAPAFRSRSLTNDVVAFNAHFKDAAEAAGGVFVDVWEGFVDQNGAYMRSGPDVNGQVVRLRNNDGINLTRAGRRKMAYFAEKDVRKLLGGADDASFGSIEGIAFAPLGDDLLDAPLQPQSSTPVALGDLAGEVETLVTGAAETAPSEPAVNPGLVIQEPVGVPEGRADNFTWPQG